MHGPSAALQPDDELTRAGAHMMTVCNACRYCEQYCPVFPAMEQRLTFAKPDLTYLANLCHNCGECLYACQYAPPHEFGINVPKMMATLRLRTYEEYAWPRSLGAAFRHNSLLTGLLLAAGLIAVMGAAAFATNGAVLLSPGSGADFYAVVPHAVMVSLFGGVFAFALIALSVGVIRCWRDIHSETEPSASGRRKSPARPSITRTLRDVLSLRHLHASGQDCVTVEEIRTPWRRWFHHCTFYGFMLCFASTSVAALYHTGFGWEAPYAYTSLPVLLGTVGGVGLLIGPAGLLVLRGRRDPELGDASQRGLDDSFIALLFLTSVTGLALLVLRHEAIMGLLLIVHLGAVLALFLTLPYGKFVHGLYRTAALLKYSGEHRVDEGRHT
jgi:citrate/tricarballylate utilization protein